VNNHFYRLIAGTLELKGSLTSMGQAIIYYDLLAVFGLICAFLVAKLPRKSLQIIAASIIGLGFSAAITIHALNEPYLWVYVVMSGLPIILCGAAGVLFHQIVANKNPEQARKRKPLFLFALFSLGFISKIALNVHSFHYGFVLAMPASLVCIWVLMDAFPGFLDRKFPGTRRVPSVIGLAFIYGILVSHFNLSFFSYTQKQYAIGEKNDRIISWHPRAKNTYISAFITTHERGVVFKETLDELKKILKPADTLLVVPEGALFNYLLRHRNPTPYTSFLLGDLVMFDESQMVRNMKKTPPDYIVLADRDLQVYGYDEFGLDTGQQIMNWINQNYVIIRQFGKAPFQSNGFGTRILKRFSNTN
jgi:hypothetical protein